MKKYLIILLLPFSIFFASFNNIEINKTKTVLIEKRKLSLEKRKKIQRKRKKKNPDDCPQIDCAH